MIETQQERRIAVLERELRETCAALDEALRQLRDSSRAPDMRAAMTEARTRDKRKANG
jgi:hypothetical protein